MPTDSRHRLTRTYYPEIDFGGFTRADGSVQFYNRVNALLKETDVLLDVGCGRGAWMDSGHDYLKTLRNFKNRCQRVIGIDLADAGEANASLDEFRKLDPAAPRWPVEDQEVDLLFADSVIEHIEEPEAFFRECRRVLKPGGFLCLRTYNVLHYNGWVSRLVPNRLHHNVLRVAQPDRKEEDVFATWYRCNTPVRMKRLLRTAGFEACVHTH
ncbi:MAG: class I SAM-dependent methyltransferase, partial [Verrucomicrobiota bacterium]